jgi:hypothetical protein
MLKSAVTADLVTKLPWHVGAYDRDLHLLLGANEVVGDVQLPYILLLKATKHACVCVLLFKLCLLGFTMSLRVGFAHVLLI